MTAAALASNEAERLRSLAQLDVLDSALESEFDALVKTAALVYGTPISLISLIDADRQRFKANVGLQWLQILGYTRDEVLGRRSVDFLTTLRK